MKYLTKFANHTAYQTYVNGSTYITPNVSLCASEIEIHYNPYVDPYNGHEYVEIGGLKWATMNVGANSVTDYGLYFQWGDTQGYTASQVGSGSGQKYFGWADYKYCNGTSSVMTKYNDTDGKTVLDIEDDAVRANWGGVWRMPTTAELQALGDAVNAVWTTNYQGSGINGLLCTDKTDSSKTLFFLSFFYCSNGSVDSVGVEGRCWSSSLNTGLPKSAFRLYFSNGVTNWNSDSYRYNSFTVRGVAD